MVYNTTSTIVAGKLNVHLVAHTHDDVGWLKTVDQYYVGSSNSIQGACVRNILDSVVQALLVDQNRKFVYVEQAFFQRWWRDQSEKMKDTVKKLVSSGQLQFINGGMCMHDEATPHYIEMIDQTTLGHRFIKREFDMTPRIGWHIDPFGHSAVQAYLLGAEVKRNGISIFIFQEGMWSIVAELAQLYPLYQDSEEGEQANIDFLKTHIGTTFDLRPQASWVSNINPDDIQSGDFLALSKICESAGIFETLEKWFIGAGAGHAAVCLRDPQGKLWVRESGRVDDKGLDIIGIILWEDDKVQNGGRTSW